ncbi:hypothetical protein NtRootA1_37770 [Arthrobacter sp. NtRootA1]|nr:hypothetical protein NtRootA1_37770 [Arthrobacter sp. NtRootA1]
MNYHHARGVLTLIETNSANTQPKRGAQRLEGNQTRSGTHASDAQVAPGVVNYHHARSLLTIIEAKSANTQPKTAAQRLEGNQTR